MTLLHINSHAKIKTFLLKYCFHYCYRDETHGDEIKEKVETVDVGVQTDT